MTVDMEGEDPGWDLRFTIREEVAEKGLALHGNSGEVTAAGSPCNCQWMAFVFGLTFACTAGLGTILDALRLEVDPQKS